LPAGRGYLRLGIAVQLWYVFSLSHPISSLCIRGIFASVCSFPKKKPDSFGIKTGYDNEYLEFATNDANQDTKTGTIVFDSIYNCYPNGEIVWSVWCGGGGKCDKQSTAGTHALCKGEPVDTGRAPPSYPEEGEPYQEDEPYYEEEPYYEDEPYVPDEEWYP